MVIVKDQGAVHIFVRTIRKRNINALTVTAGYELLKEPRQARCCRILVVLTIHTENQNLVFVNASMSLVADNC